jgi:hypothetical protein
VVLSSPRTGVARTSTKVARKQETVCVALDRRSLHMGIGTGRFYTPVGPGETRNRRGRQLRFASPAATIDG